MSRHTTSFLRNKSSQGSSRASGKTKDDEYISPHVCRAFGLSVRDGNRFPVHIQAESSVRREGAKRGDHLRWVKSEVTANIRGKRHRSQTDIHCTVGFLLSLASQSVQSPPANTAAAGKACPMNRDNIFLYFPEAGGKVIGRQAALVDSSRMTKPQAQFSQPVTDLAGEPCRVRIPGFRSGG